MASSALEIFSNSKTSMAVPRSARKRKREDEKMLLGDPFTVQPHSSSVFDSSIKITPTVVLARSFVPLTWLAGMPSRLFSTTTHLPALDVAGNILIVKIEGERQLSAVEKVTDGMYTIYKLSSQLKVGDVRKTVPLMKKVSSEPARIGGNDVAEGMLKKDWWADMEVPEYPMEGALCSIGHMPKLDMGLVNSGKMAVQSPATPAFSPLASSPPIRDDSQEINNFYEPTLADILEQTRAQYFETLYIAKTSLAYFAKSTLSRARVTFQQDNSTPLAFGSDNKLIAFLKDMLIPLQNMDLKYAKSIIQIATEDTVSNKSVFKPGEEEYVERWRNAVFSDKMLQSNDASLKRKVSELKIRETELQIIFVLEILALQKDQPSFAITAETDKKPSKKKQKKGKEKNKEALIPEPEILLDLLVDRLCIWRSLGSASAEFNEEDDIATDAPDKGGESDHLRHFCVEVVMAFYASRLPDHCDLLHKKCGGPSLKKKTPQSRSSRDKRVTATKKKAPLTRSITAPAGFSSGRQTSVDIAALVAADGGSQPKSNSRGGTLSSKSFAKREVHIPTKVVQKNKKVEEELKEAIKALVKPNRGAAGKEFVEEAKERFTTAEAKRKTGVQVMATPKKRKPTTARRQATLTSLPEYGEVSQVNTPANGAGSNPYMLATPSRVDLFGLESIPSTSPYDLPVEKKASTSRPFVFATPQKRYSTVGNKLDLEIVPSTSPYESTAHESHRSRSQPSVPLYPNMMASPQKEKLPKQRIVSGNLGINRIPSSTKKLPPTASLPRSISFSALEGKSIPCTPKRNAQRPVMEDDSSPGGVRLFETPLKPERAPLPPSSSPPPPPPPPLLQQKGNTKKETCIYDSLGWEDDFDF